ncbi:MAG TPA: hypothetical protein VK066_06810 [Chloroflexota bacterium]|nr:hypothetical protein [Chloroflexota bacterium]
MAEPYWHIGYVVATDEADDKTMMKFRDQFVNALRDQYNLKADTDYKLVRFKPGADETFVLPGKSRRTARRGSDPRWRDLDAQLTEWLRAPTELSPDDIRRIVVILDTSAISTVWNWASGQGGVPAVLAISHNPTAHGLKALEAPGNSKGTTGIVASTAEHVWTRLELIKQVTNATKVIVLYFPYTNGLKEAEYHYKANGEQEGQLACAAAALGVELVPCKVTKTVESDFKAELDSQLDNAIKQVSDARKALYLVSHPRLAYFSKSIAQAAWEKKLWGIYPYRKFTLGKDDDDHLGEEGGLMSYGANPFAMAARVAPYIARIMRFGGTPPTKTQQQLAAFAETMPMEGPTQMELVLNQKAADHLQTGYTLPTNLLPATALNAVDLWRPTKDTGTL